MTGLFLESFWTLLAVLVAVQFVLIVIWSRLRTDRTARAVWIGFAAIPALLILSTVVKTPRERIIAVCKEMADGAEAADIRAIGLHISERFEAGGFGKDALLSRVERTLERYGVEYPELHGFDVTFPTRDSALCTFNASCRIDVPDAYVGWLPSRWQLTFEKSGNDWRVVAAETLPVAPLYLSHLDEALR